jgi:hypothetical protein
MTTPSPDGFRPLHPIFFALIDGSVAVLVASVLDPGVARSVRRAVPGLSDRRLRQLVAVTVTAHVLEATAAWRTARRKGLPPAPWASQTALVGFPSMVALLRSPGARTAPDPDHRRREPANGA